MLRWSVTARRMQRSCSVSWGSQTLLVALELDGSLTCDCYVVPTSSSYPRWSLASPPASFPSFTISSESPRCVGWMGCSLDHSWPSFQWFWQSLWAYTGWLVALDWSGYSWVPVSSSRHQLWVSFSKRHECQWWPTVQYLPWMPFQSLFSSFTGAQFGASCVFSVTNKMQVHLANVSMAVCHPPQNKHSSAQCISLPVRSFYSQNVHVDLSLCVKRSVEGRHWELEGFILLHVDRSSAVFVCHDVCTFGEKISAEFQLRRRQGQWRQKSVTLLFKTF